MSKLAQLDIYKPEILHCEVQHFRTNYVCWFSGPYFTRKIKGANHFRLEILRGKFRFKQSLSTIASVFYKTQNYRDWQTIQKRLNLSHVYLKQWIFGCVGGFRNAVRVRGIGYRFEVYPTYILIHAGYSHLLSKKVPFSIFFKSPSAQQTALTVNRKATLLNIKSADLFALNFFLSTVRNLRQPDVYKGKGIRYQKDIVKRKEGKRKKTM